MKRTRFAIGGLLMAAAMAAPAAGWADEPADDGWRQATLLDQSIALDLRTVEAGVVTIEGSPNTDDDRTFDVKITVAGQELPTVTIYTGGVLNGFRYKLVSLPIGHFVIRVALDYRYDEKQYVCAAAMAGGCVARLPLDVLARNWMMERSGEAAIFVQTDVHMNGERAASRRMGIPLVGQVAGAVDG